MIKQMRKENLIKFDILKKAGILFTDFQKVTDFLNENSNNIDKWWNSDAVQNAREEFTEKYSRTVKFPTNYLSKLFQENL